MFQEVHCSENTILRWSTEWGCKTIFNAPAGIQGEVAILFRNTHEKITRL